MRNKCESSRYSGLVNTHGRDEDSLLGALCGSHAHFSTLSAPAHRLRAETLRTGLRAELWVCERWPVRPTQRTLHLPARLVRPELRRRWWHHRQPLNQTQLSPDLRRRLATDYTWGEKPLKTMERLKGFSHVCFVFLCFPGGPLKSGHQINRLPGRT